MESMHLFLQEVTQELLYNIVYNVCDVEGIEFRELSEKFETEFGHRPMDFFDFDNHTEKGWIGFLKSSPGLRFIKGKVSISIDEIGKCVAYKKFNKTNMHLRDESFNDTVAKYRQILIQKACELICQQTDAVSTDVVDAHGNTPLHLIAALPCIDHEPTLVKHLLNAGFEPLKTNNDRQTILHIIAGRMQAEVVKDADDNVDLDSGSFGNGKFDPSRWPANDITALLQLLSELLSHGQLTVLAKMPNGNGNTAMHEWVLSVSTITSRGLQLGFDEAEKEIGSKLLSFGADLRQQNNSGEIPLHYAYNSDIFQFLLENSEQKTFAVYCRVRNEREETPLLRILKYATNLASKSAADEMNTTAMLLLQQLTELVTKNKDVCKTAWMPDVDGISAVDIILSTIPNVSCSASEPGTILTNFYALFRSSSQEKKDGKFRAFRQDLIKFLERSLGVANEYDLKRRSLLHVLLDLGEININVIIDDAELLQSVELLLQHNAEINAIDSKGRTPLDVIKEYKSKMASNSFFTKCEEKLLDNGAKCGSSLRSSVGQKTSAPNTENKMRKLLSCPKKYSSSAQQLINCKCKDKVTVVDRKYRYSDRDPIGSGAFSSIFVAVKDENVDSKSGMINCRAYALKRIEKAKMNPAEIKREINTLLSISGKCDNIIKYHDSVEDDFFQYLCLDLMDGDLNEFVTNNSVNKVLEDPAIRVHVSKEIINGLAYLHEHKFIHRDLKPGNILYTTDPTLHFKIADFGLTKNTSTLSTMTTTRGSGVAMAPGTRCWMAPELVSMKSREHSKESDVFSLGLVLHYLLTVGKHPFATGSEEPAHVIERRIVDTQIHFEQVFPPETASFYQVLLTKDPSKRPPAKGLNHHPFLWSEGKKIEFLEAVGNQPEAASPTNYPNSPLEQVLQMTNIGQNVQSSPWDLVIKALFAEMTAAWKQKKYRTDKVIDLVRFIRNAYAHKQERSSVVLGDLDRNIFLRAFPSLVLDVFSVVQDLNLNEHRSNIRQALSSDV